MPSALGGLELHLLIHPRLQHPTIGVDGELFGAPHRNTLGFAVGVAVVSCVGITLSAQTDDFLQQLLRSLAFEVPRYLCFVFGIQVVVLGEITEVEFFGEVLVLLSEVLPDVAGLDLKDERVRVGVDQADVLSTVCGDELVVEEARHQDLRVVENLTSNIHRFVELDAALAMGDNRHVVDDDVLTALEPKLALLADEVLFVAGGCDDGVGSATDVLHGLAEDRVVQEFVQPFAEVAGCLLTESGVELDVWFEPRALLEGDAAVDCGDDESVLDGELELFDVDDVLLALLEVGDELWDGAEGDVTKCLLLVVAEFVVCDRSVVGKQGEIVVEFV
ncbi:hypothetical protein DIPPA_27460 [Diplonema papillatum]|nr:hypothetical protein DIPPA_27460 [Diplonema papillatum]